MKIQFFKRCSDEYPHSVPSHDGNPAVSVYGAAAVAVPTQDGELLRCRLESINTPRHHQAFSLYANNFLTAAVQVGCAHLPGPPLTGTTRNRHVDIHSQNGDSVANIVCTRSCAQVLQNRPALVVAERFAYNSRLGVWAADQPSVNQYGLDELRRTMPSSSIAIIFALLGVGVFLLFLQQISESGQRRTPMIIAAPTSPEYLLSKLTPQRRSRATFQTVVDMLESQRENDAFSLELATSSGSGSILLRNRWSSPVSQVLYTHFSDSTIDVVKQDDDPMRLAQGEEILTRTLRFEGPPHSPIRVTEQDAIERTGADPLVPLVNALQMADAAKRERLVSRLLLRPQPINWMQKQYRGALSGAGGENQRLANLEQHKPKMDNAELLPFALLLTGLAGMFGWRFYENEQYLYLAALIGGAVGVGGLGLFIRRLMKPEYRFYDAEMVFQRVAWGGFAAEIQIHAITPRAPTQPQRAKSLLDAVESSYRQFDNPMGTRIVSDGDSDARPSERDLLTLGSERGMRLFRRASYQNAVGSKEVASLWHPLVQVADEGRAMERTQYYTLPADPGLFSEGALVGVTTAGDDPHLVRIPTDTMRMHQLAIAKTRMGKSTLMGHEIHHILREKALGLNDNALIVVDPHADLVTHALTQVPRKMADKVWLIDLGDASRAPGINLIDAFMFPNRETTISSIINVVKGQWDSWGVRMQNVLQQALGTLYEANRRFDDPEDQYTFIDAARILVDDDFRRETLNRIEDGYLLEYWINQFDKMDRVRLRPEVIAPVQTRMDYYLNSRLHGRF